MGLLASEAHPISFVVLVADACGGSVSALGGSGIAHALPPNTSFSAQAFVLSEPMELRGLEVVVDVVVVVVVVAAGFCWFAERLKTDVEAVVVDGDNAG